MDLSTLKKVLSSINLSSNPKIDELERWDYEMEDDVFPKLKLWLRNKDCIVVLNMVVLIRSHVKS